MSNYSTDTENSASALTGILIALFVFLGIAFLADTAPGMGIKALAATNQVQTVLATVPHAHKVS